MKKCPKCGMEYISDVYTCYKCGYNFYSEEEIKKKEEKREKVNYSYWIANRSYDFGIRKICLVIATVLVGMTGGFYGLLLFPEGRYPKIILMLPGLFIAGAFYLIVGYFYYIIPKEKGIFAVILTIIVVIVCIGLTINFFVRIV